MDGRLDSSRPARGELDVDHHFLFSKGPPESLERPEPDPLPVRPPRRRRWRRVVIIASLATVIIVLSAAGGLFLSSERLGNNVARVPDVFAPLERSPRPPVQDDRMSFLLVGTDSRPAAEEGPQEGDMLMLARVDIDAARTGASVISIPRDSWVDIPGRGRNRIDSAYTAGGPSLLVQTVEQLTGARIDHLAIIDFAGFRAMVDAVGGIDLQQRAGLPAGPVHLNGTQALAYLRQLDNLPRGDVDRAARMQGALRALLDKAASSGMLASPAQVYELLDAVSRAVSVDDTLSNDDLRGLGLQMSGLRSSDVRFVVAPVRATDRQGARPVAYLDVERSAELWNAVRINSVPEYVQRYPADAVSPPPR